MHAKPANAFAAVYLETSPSALCCTQGDESGLGAPLLGGSSAAAAAASAQRGSGVAIAAASTQHGSGAAAAAHPTGPWLEEQWPKPQPGAAGQRSMCASGAAAAGLEVVREVLLPIGVLLVGVGFSVAALWVAAETYL